MISFRAVILASGVLAVAGPGTSPEGRAEEIRALWVTRWDYTTEAHVRTILDNARACRFNTVLFQVRGNGSVFYRSELEPWAWELTGSDPSTLGIDPGWDPLETAIAYGRGLGLEIHAYINVYPGWRGMIPPPETMPRQLWRARPAWFCVDSGGNPVALNDHYAPLSPGIPEVQDYLVEICAELVGSYDVDGVHLDYVRYFGSAYSWDPVSLARFPEEHPGATPETHPAEWESWRRDQVTALVDSIRSRVQAIRPTCQITAATWSNYASGSTAYGQDSRGWLAAGILDVSHPMNYTQNTASHRASTEAHVLHAAHRYVSSGVGAHQLQGDPESLVRQVRNTRDMGAHGVTVFAYTSLFPGHAPNELAVALGEGPFRFADHPPPRRWLPGSGDEDDTGPRIFNVKTDPEPPLKGQPVVVHADITDPSGVFDDDTGPEGQGVRLRWALNADPREGAVVAMSRRTGDTFVSDTPLPPPAADGVLFLQIVAYDDNGDGDPGARTPRESAIHDFSVVPSVLYVFDAEIGPALATPQYCVLDPGGRLWVCDWSSHAVRVFDDDGALSDPDPVVRGLNAAGEPVEARYPSGAACDDAGTVYITIDNVYDEPFYTGVLRFDAATGLALPGIDLEFRPGDCDVDAAGNLYIVEKLNARWHLLTPPGVFSSDRAFGSGQADRINRGLACRDDGGRVYIASQHDGAVQVWNRVSSAPPDFVQGGDLCSTTGASGAVDVDAHGWVFAGDHDRGIVYVYTEAHELTQHIRGGTPVFGSPRGVAHTPDSEAIFIVPMSGARRLQRWRRTWDPFLDGHDLALY